MAVALVILALLLIVFVLWGILVSKGKRTQVIITPEDFQLSAQTLSFTTQDNVRLEGWLIKNPHTHKTIVLVHGFGMNKGAVLKRTYFLAKDYNLLYLDCRGAGESDGRSTAGIKESKDVQAAVEYLKKNEPALAQEIGLYGISMGSAAAAYYCATQGGINCLVLESSYYSFKNVAKRWMWKHAKVPYFPLVAFLVFRKERKLGLKVENFALKQTAARITCPVLMIQGEKDKLTPVSKAKKTYRHLAGPKELWIVPQATHLSCYRFGGDEYIQKITRFFHKNL